MTGPQAGYCHLKGHLHNWGHMGNFRARPSCSLFYSILSDVSFLYYIFVVFLSGVTKILGGQGREFTTAASNKNYELKKVTVIECYLIWLNVL
jgi:hypothetical protein